MKAAGGAALGAFAILIFMNEFSLLFLSFFAQVVNGGFKVTVGFHQRLFAIHHAGTGLLAQFIYISCRYLYCRHCFMFLNVVIML